MAVMIRKSAEFHAEQERQLSAEIERLRRINSELVRNYNTLLRERAIQGATPEARKLAVQTARSHVLDALRGINSALEIVEIEDPS